MRKIMEEEAFEKTTQWNLDDMAEPSEMRTMIVAMTPVNNRTKDTVFRQHAVDPYDLAPSMSPTTFLSLDFTEKYNASKPRQKGLR